MQKGLKRMSVESSQSNAVSKKVHSWRCKKYGNLSCWIKTDCQDSFVAGMGHFMKFTCFLPQHTHGLSNQGTLFVIRMGPFHGISMCWGNALRNCTYPLQKLLTEPYLILCWGNALRHCTYRIWVCVGGTHFDIALTSEKQRILFQILDVSLLRPGRDSDAIWPSCLRCLVLLINHGDS